MFNIKCKIADWHSKFFILNLRHGSRMVADNKINAGELLIVFFCVMIGAAQLGQVGPSFEAISNARGAAFKVFEIIGRTPTIDCISDEGQKFDNVTGNIEFNDVEFHYPSRPEIKVFATNFNWNSNKN